MLRVGLPQEECDVSLFEIQAFIQDVMLLLTLLSAHLCPSFWALSALAGTDSKIVLWTSLCWRKGNPHTTPYPFSVPCVPLLPLLPVTEPRVSVPAVRGLQRHVGEPRLPALRWASHPATEGGAAFAQSGGEAGIFYQHLQRLGHPWVPTTWSPHQHVATLQSRTRTS